MDREETNLNSAELIRLGEFVWELLLRLGNRYLPPQMEEDETFPKAWSEAPANFFPLGQYVHDTYIHMGGERHHPTFSEGVLFWQALTEAIAYLFDERKNRVTVIDWDGAHPEPAPAPRSIPLEYIARYIAVDAPAEGEATLPRSELAARVRFSLTLDPLCADAYHTQGEMEEADGGFQQARIAYERALRIASLLIGLETIAAAEASEAMNANFWYTSDTTRVYMRARASLARLLWRRLCDLRGAIAHFNVLLNLDPGDHQNCRHALMCCLLEADDREALGALLARCRLSTYALSEGTHQVLEDTTDTWWHYTHTCRLFQMACALESKETGFQQAAQALSRAVQVNGYVPLLLLNSTQRPEQNTYLDVSPGSLGEAIKYVDMALTAWKNTPRALQWLEATHLSIQ